MALFWVVIMACGVAEGAAGVQSERLPALAALLWESGPVVVGIHRTLNLHLIKSQTQGKVALKSPQAGVFFTSKDGMEKGTDLELVTYVQKAFQGFAKPGVRNSRRS